MFVGVLLSVYILVLRILNEFVVERIGRIVLKHLLCWFVTADEVSIRLETDLCVRIELVGFIFGESVRKYYQERFSKAPIPIRLQELSAEKVTVKFYLFNLLEKGCTVNVENVVLKIQPAIYPLEEDLREFFLVPKFPRILQENISLSPEERSVDILKDLVNLVCTSATLEVNQFSAIFEDNFTNELHPYQISLQVKHTHIRPHYPESLGICYRESLNWRLYLDELEISTLSTRMNIKTPLLRYKSEFKVDFSIDWILTGWASKFFYVSDLRMRNLIVNFHVLFEKDCLDISIFPAHIDIVIDLIHHVKMFLRRYRLKRFQPCFIFHENRAKELWLYAQHCIVHSLREELNLLGVLNWSALKESLKKLSAYQKCFQSYFLGNRNDSTIYELIKLERSMDLSSIISCRFQVLKTLCTMSTIGQCLKKFQFPLLSMIRSFITLSKYYPRVHKWNVLYSFKVSSSKLHINLHDLGGRIVTASYIDEFVLNFERDMNKIRVYFEVETVLAFCKPHHCNSDSPLNYIFFKEKVDPLDIKFSITKIIEMINEPSRTFEKWNIFGKLNPVGVYIMLPLVSSLVNWVNYRAYDHPFIPTEKLFIRAEGADIAVKTVQNRFSRSLHHENIFDFNINLLDVEIIISKEFIGNESLRFDCFVLNLRKLKISSCDKSNEEIQNDSILNPLVDTKKTRAFQAIQLELHNFEMISRCGLRKIDLINFQTDALEPMILFSVLIPKYTSLSLGEATIHSHRDLSILTISSFLKVSPMSIWASPSTIESFFEMAMEMSRILSFKTEYFSFLYSPKELMDYLRELKQQLLSTQEIGIQKSFTRDMDIFSQSHRSHKILGRSYAISLDVPRITIHFLQLGLTSSKVIVRPAIRINLESIRGQLLNQVAGKTSLDVGSRISCDVFDFLRLSWFPVLEPWDASVFLSSDIFSHLEASISVGELDKLSITLSTALLQRINGVLGEWLQLWRKDNNLHVEDVFSYLFRNCSGIPLRVWESSKLSTSSFLNPGEETFFESFSVSDELDLCNLKVGETWEKTHPRINLQLSDGLCFEDLEIIEGTKVLNLASIPGRSVLLFEVRFQKKVVEIVVKSLLKICNHTRIDFGVFLEDTITNKTQWILANANDLNVFVPISWLNRSSFHLQPTISRYNLSSPFDIKSIQKYQFERLLIFNHSSSSTFESLPPLQSSDKFDFNNFLPEMLSGGSAVESSNLAIKVGNKFEEIKLIHSTRSSSKSMGQISDVLTVSDVNPISTTLTELHIFPPLIVENCLPHRIQYRILVFDPLKIPRIIKQGTLDPGSGIDFYFAFQTILISFKISRLESWTKPMEIRQEWQTSSSSSRSVSIEEVIPVYREDLLIYYLYLDIRKEFNGLSGWMIYVYVPYWIVNLCNFPVIIRETSLQQNLNLIQRIVPSSAELMTQNQAGSDFFLFGPKSRQNSSLEFGRIFQKETYFSTGQHVSHIPGNSIVDILPKEQMKSVDKFQQSISVTLENSGARSKFSRTEILKISPSTIFVNTFDVPLYIRQPGSNNEFKVEPHAMNFDFYWPRSDYPQCIELSFSTVCTVKDRFYNLETVRFQNGQEFVPDVWSGIIDLKKTDVGRLFCFWDGLVYGTSWLEVEMKKRENVLFVIFRRGDEAFPPYRFENRSSLVISISQIDVNENFQLFPFSVRRFVWREPSQPHKVILNIEKEHIVVLHLDDEKFPDAIECSEYKLSFERSKDGPTTVIQIVQCDSNWNYSKESKSAILRNKISKIESNIADLDEELRRAKEIMLKKASEPFILFLSVLRAKNLFNKSLTSKEVSIKMRAHKETRNLIAKSSGFHPRFSESVELPISKSVEKIALLLNDGAIGICWIYLSEAKFHAENFEDTGKEEIFFNWITVHKSTDDIDTDKKRDFDSYAKLEAGKYVGDYDNAKLLARIQLVTDKKTLLKKYEERFERETERLKKIIFALERELTHFSTSLDRLAILQSNYSAEPDFPSDSKGYEDLIHYRKSVNAGCFKLSCNSLHIPQAIWSSSRTFGRISYDSQKNHPFLLIQYGSQEKRSKSGLAELSHWNTFKIDGEWEFGVEEHHSIRFAVFISEESSDPKFLGEALLSPQKYSSVKDHLPIRVWLNLHSLNGDGMLMGTDLEEGIGQILIKFEWIRKDILDKRFTLSLSIELPSFECSVIDQSKGRELLYLSANGISGESIFFTDGSSSFFSQIDWIQVDNPSPTSPNPVLLSVVRNPFKPFKPFISIRASLKHASRAFDLIPEVNIEFQTLRASADDRILIDLLIFLYELFDFSGSKYDLKSLIGHREDIPHFPSLPDAKLNDKSRAFFEKLSISRVQLFLSFSNSGERGPHVDNHVWDLLIRWASTVSFRDAKIDIRSLNIRNLFLSYSDFSSMIVRHYILNLWFATRSLTSILGSTSTLGNPSYFMKCIRTGISDFINEPRRERLLLGFLKGSQSLFYHFVMGVSNSMARWTVILAKALSNISFDSSFIDFTQKIRNRIDRGHQQARTLIWDGFLALSVGIASGISGVVIFPWRDFERHGSRGAISGIGKGAIGLFLKPFSGALQFSATLLQATHDLSLRRISQFEFFENLIPMRYPRPVYFGGNIATYDLEFAQGLTALHLLRNTSASTEKIIDVMQLTNDGSFAILGIQWFFIVKAYYKAGTRLMILSRLKFRRELVKFRIVSLENSNLFLHVSDAKPLSLKIENVNERIERVSQFLEKSNNFINKSRSGKILKIEESPVDKDSLMHPFDVLLHEFNVEQEIKQVKYLMENNIYLLKVTPYSRPQFRLTIHKFFTPLLELIWHNLQGVEFSDASRMELQVFVSFDEVRHIMRIPLQDLGSFSDLKISVPLSKKTILKSIRIETYLQRSRFLPARVFIDPVNLVLPSVTTFQGLEACLDHELSINVQGRIMKFSFNIEIFSSKSMHRTLNQQSLSSIVSIYEACLQPVMPFLMCGNSVALCSRRLEQVPLYSFVKKDEDLNSNVYEDWNLCKRLLIVEELLIEKYRILRSEGGNLKIWILNVENSIQDDQEIMYSFYNWQISYPLDEHQHRSLQPRSKKLNGKAWRNGRDLLFQEEVRIIVQKPDAFSLKLSLKRRRSSGSRFLGHPTVASRTFSLHDLLLVASSESPQQLPLYRLNKRNVLKISKKTYPRGSVNAHADFQLRLRVGLADEEAHLYIRELERLRLSWKEHAEDLNFN